MNYENGEVTHEYHPIPFTNVVFSGSYIFVPDQPVILCVYGISAIIKNTFRNIYENMGCPVHLMCISSDMYIIQFPNKVYLDQYTWKIYVRCIQMLHLFCKADLSSIPQGIHRNGLCYDPIDYNFCKYS